MIDPADNPCPFGTYDNPADVTWAFGVLPDGDSELYADCTVVLTISDISVS